MLKRVYIKPQYLTFLALLSMRELIATATQSGRKRSARYILPHGEFVSPDGAVLLIQKGKLKMNVRTKGHSNIRALPKEAMHTY